MYQGTGKITSLYRGIGITILEKNNHCYRYIGIRVINIMINFIVILGLILRLDCYVVILISGILLYRRFCSIQSTVAFAGLKNINGYIGNIVISKIVLSGFYCRLV